MDTCRSTQRHKLGGTYPYSSPTQAGLSRCGRRKVQRARRTGMWCEIGLALAGFAPPSDFDGDLGRRRRGVVRRLRARGSPDEYDQCKERERHAGDGHDAKREHSGCAAEAD